MLFESVLVFVVLVAGSLTAASMGAVFRPGAWYAGLRKPAWVPPNRLFAPAWTVMYTLMTAAAFLVWHFGEGTVGTAALIAYAVQLGLNALWSPVFFGLRRMGAGFAVVAALWGAVLVTTLLFFQVSPWTGLLLVPYLAWVTFASALNLSVWRLNRAAEAG